MQRSVPEVGGETGEGDFGFAGGEIELGGAGDEGPVGKHGDRDGARGDFKGFSGGDGREDEQQEGARTERRFHDGGLG